MKTSSYFFQFPEGSFWRFFAKLSRLSRKRKFDLFMKTFSPDQETKILDAGAFGGRGLEKLKNYWPINFLEKWYPYKDKLTALGVTDLAGLQRMYPEIRAVRYQGNVFPFKDKEFDLVFSNAVIEHVGSRQNQQFFLDEIIRVGRKAFITTPNRWFFLEMHTWFPFLHWLPQPWFGKLVGLFGRSYWGSEKNLNLLSPMSIHKLLKKYSGRSNVKMKWNLFTPDVIILINSF